MAGKTASTPRPGAFEPGGVVGFAVVVGGEGVVASGCGVAYSWHVLHCPLDHGTVRGSDRRILRRTRHHGLDPSHRVVREEL